MRAKSKGVRTQTSERVLLGLLKRLRRDRAGEKDMVQDRERDFKQGLVFAAALVQKAIARWMSKTGKIRFAIRLSPESL